MMLIVDVPVARVSTVHDFAGISVPLLTDYSMHARGIKENTVKHYTLEFFRVPSNKPRRCS